MSDEKDTLSPMSAPEFLASLAQVGPIMRDAVVSGNWKVLAGMLGPGYRGFVQHIGKRASSTKMPMLKINAKSVMRLSV